MSEQPFDPSRYLTKVGSADYLEVKWRLVWFRENHPNGSITTRLIEHQFGEYAVFEATAANGDGGVAMGYGSETPRDFRDYLEKAETKAIGRALAALGFGTQFSAFEFGGEADAERVVDSPVHARQNTPIAPGRARGTSQSTAPQSGRPAIQNPSAPASDSQLNYIRGLAKQAGMVIIGPDGDEHVNEQELASWIGGEYRRDWPQINKGDASEIIEGLKEEARKAATQR